MAVKPNGAAWTIREQIVEDPASGLTFQFLVTTAADAPYKLKVFGDGLPFGNREIVFDAEGREAGAGTLLAESCAPSWLQRVK